MNLVRLSNNLRLLFCGVTILPAYVIASTDVLLELGYGERIIDFYDEQEYRYFLIKGKGYEHLNKRKGGKNND